MSNVTFGVSLSEYFDLNEAIQVAQTVEKLGFDSLWLTELVYPGIVSLEPLITLGIFAAHTKRVKLGPAVVLLPLHNPVRLAHASVTLDRLSGGRFILGVGSGGDSPASRRHPDQRPDRRIGFEAYGVSVKERGARCDEALEIIKRLWTEPFVSFSGKFWNFTDYTLGARPTQQPHPPIWMAGARAESVLRRTAHYGDGFYPSRLTPSELSQMNSRIMKYAEEYGRDMSTFTKSVYLRFCLNDSLEEAQRVCHRVMEARYKVPAKLGGTSGESDAALLESFRLAYADEPIGPPERCVEILQEYVAAGATDIVLDMSCPADELLSQLHTIAERVMPHFE